MIARCKFKEIDGLIYEEQGPYCVLCGAHMGQYYCAKGEPTFLDPHNWQDYGGNTCPQCGAEYTYEEGNDLDLTVEDLEAIRKVRGIEAGKPYTWQEQWEDLQ